MLQTKTSLFETNAPHVHGMLRAITILNENQFIAGIITKILKVIAAVDTIVAFNCVYLYKKFGLYFMKYEVSRTQRSRFSADLRFIISL